MGIDIDIWRKRIGGFSQPFKGRFPLETLKLKHLSLYIRVCLFLLLVVQGVETNPGPNPAPSFGTSSGPARGGSTSGPRNSIGAANKPSGYSNASRGRGANAAGRGASRRSTTYDNSQPASDRVLRSADASQNVMNAWLNSDRRSSDFGYNTQSGSEQNRGLGSPFSTGLYDDVGDGDIDIKTVLLDIRREVRMTNSKFDNLERQVRDLKTDHEQLKTEHDDLKSSHENLKTENETLTKKVNNMSKKLDQLENQSRRENLVFHGLKEDPNESWEDSENKIRAYISNDLGLDDSRISIERAHRLKAKTFPRPIIAKFSLFKDRDRVLKKYREKRDSAQNEDDGQQSDHGTNATEGEAAESRKEPVVRVSEDFSARVRRIRRSLRPFLIDFLKQTDDAYIKVDKLIVDGTVHGYDEIEKKLVVE